MSPHASPSVPVGQSQAPHDLEGFRAPPHAAVLALWLYLAGMSIAFVWLLAGYLVMKGRAEVADPGLPAWFWLSTGLVLVGSLFVHWAWRGGLAESPPTVRHGLDAAIVLGTLFLISQVMGFIELLGTHLDVPGVHRLFQMTFLLALLHGVHVVVGLADLVVVRLTLARPTRSSDDRARPLRLAVIYWHYLTVVWMVMFSVFLLAPGVG